MSTSWSRIHRWFRMRAGQSTPSDALLRAFGPLWEITVTPLEDTCYLPRDDLEQFAIKIPYHLRPSGSSAICHLEYTRMIFESVGGRLRLLLKAKTLVSTDENMAHFPHLPSRFWTTFLNSPTAVGRTTVLMGNSDIQSAQLPCSCWICF